MSLTKDIGGTGAGLTPFTYSSEAANTDARRKDKIHQHAALILQGLLSNRPLTRNNDIQNIEMYVNSAIDYAVALDKEINNLTIP